MNKHDRKNYIILLLVFAVLFVSIIMVGCNENTNDERDDNRLQVTLLNGEHYSVIGENKRAVGASNEVSFDIVLDKGHKVIGAFGNECTVTNYTSFNQTVTFLNVRYTSTARLETAEMGRSEFIVSTNNDEAGEISIDGLWEKVSEDLYYTEDTLNISTTSNEGYAFRCWSLNNFIDAGGEFYSFNSELKGFDFVNNARLYANFRDLSDAGNMILYEVDGQEIEHDCTAMLAHHPRANTYTAEDMRGLGIDCDSRMLVGWKTQEGEYLGLGSRVAVSDKTATVLYPEWKEYSDEKDFVYELIGEGDGKITKYNGGEKQGIVIPNEIDGVKITAIGANAFKQCEAATYYIPDSITTVEDEAFSDCTGLRELYMSDNIMDIDDKAFSGCKNFTTLHINAFFKPRWMGISQGSCKVDVYDRLALNANNGNKKFVVLGGSSVWYGYSISTIEEMFLREDIKVDAYNLGYSAQMCLFVEYEIASAYLNEGDIFLHAPETTMTSWIGATNKSCLTDTSAIELKEEDIFRIIECNWQFVSDITINKYCDFFAQFEHFNIQRISNLGECEYSDYYNRFDGTNGTTPDEILQKETGVYNPMAKSPSLNFEMNELSQIVNRAIELMYIPLVEKKVNCFVGFPPVNKDTLLLTYSSIDEVNAVVDKYTEDIKTLIKTSGAHAVLSQLDMLYGSECFYDTYYHLGYPTRNEHTRRVITAVMDFLLSSDWSA